MMLFVNDNLGIIFIESIIDVIVETISSTYQNLRQIFPAKRNSMLGIMNTSGVIYCNLCINRLHIKYDNIKYLTHKHTLGHLYNCSICGIHLSKRSVRKGIGI